MNVLRYLMIVATLGLAACEQVQVFGPLGGGTITVTELRSGNEVITGNPLTFGADEVAAAVGQEKYDGYSSFQKLTVLGINQFGDLAVSDNAWYLYEVSGGFDYGSDGNAAPTQVFGTLHAVVKGSQLKESGYVVSPLTEAAYQYIKDFVDDLTDAEIEALLDQLAPQLVDDVFSKEPGINYLDVLKWNRLFHVPKLAISEASLDNLTQSLADGDNAATVKGFADALFPLSYPELVYEDSISDIIVNNPGQGGGACGPACHYPGGIGSNQSSNDLVPPSTSNYVQLNTANFAMLVNTNSVAYVVSKVQGGEGHLGGQRLSPGSDELAAFEAWLNLL